MAPALRRVPCLSPRSCPTPLYCSEQRFSQIGTFKRVKLVERRSLNTSQNQCVFTASSLPLQPYICGHTRYLQATDQSTECGIQRMPARPRLTHTHTHTQLSSSAPSTCTMRIVACVARQPLHITAAGGMHHFANSS